jgi:hypothetical protein
MNPFAHFEDQFGHLKLSDNDAALHVFLAGWNSAMMEMMQRVNKMPFQNDTRASFAVYFQSQMVNVDAIEKPAQFDPSAGMQISKVWWDGEKLMAKPIPLEDLYRPAPVQEPVIDHSCKDTYELIMKWADIYAAQTGELYSQAAQDPSKAARMADERTMLACVVAQATSQPTAPMRKREHITDGSPCWCNPETDYIDPETGAAVIVHKEPQ